MTHACPHCQTTTPTWSGSLRECAFVDGSAFSSHNWNCATVNRLRALCEPERRSVLDGVAIYATNDLWHALIDVSEVPLHEQSNSIVWLQVIWYKRRGQTLNVSVIDTEGDVASATEEQCLTTLKHLESNLAARHSSV